MRSSVMLLAALVRGEREGKRPRHIAKPSLGQGAVQFALVALQQGQGFGPLRHNADLPGILALTDADFDPAKLSGVKRNGQRFIPAPKRERNHHRGKLARRRGRGHVPRHGACQRCIGAL